MRAEVRHQLKQDRFSKTTFQVAEKTVHWSVEHKNKLVLGLAAILIVAAVAIGGWYYLNQQDQKASFELSQAVRTLDTPIRPSGTPPQPEFPSFASSKERATEAGKQLQGIVDKYPHTHTADVARYFLGVNAAQEGDYGTAERTLQSVAGLRDQDLSSLAKFAMASVYRGENRNSQAIDIYNALIAKPSSTVSKVAAQLELGATYEAASRPQDAQRIYQQVQKDNPSSQAGQLAAEKLQALK